MESRLDFGSESMPATRGESAGSSPLIYPGRRGFMRAVGGGAGMVALGSLAGCGSSSNAATPLEEMRHNLTRDAGFWADVRSKFVFPQSTALMNVGTSGSMPQPVLDRYQQETLDAAMRASGGYGNLSAERTLVAEGLGADPDELVFSYNTSDGMCQSLLGLDWQAGDVIVTTNHEHGGGNTPLNIAVDRYGIVVDRVALPTGETLPGGAPHNAAWYYQAFSDRVRQLRSEGKRVRALMWSSPTYLTGTMLPIPELMRVCKENELISIVDGAHLPGMMAYDYRELGMDFMAAAGHKWQCGPGSTGILFIRNKVRPSNPLPLPRYHPVTSSSFNPAPPAWHDRATGATATYNIGNAVQSLGSLNVPMFRALTEACQMWDGIGREKIQEYVLGLSLYLKEKIVDRWGVERLYSPRDPELLSALTSFNPFVNHDDIYSAEKSGQFVTRLREKGFGVRNTTVPAIGHPQSLRPLRISTHLWHNADDVDALVDAMWQTANELNSPV